MSHIEGKRILVLEDEFLIALHLADLLEDLGAFVVGPAYSIPQALGLLESERIDAAVLDINIKGSQSDQVARALQARKVPVIFATGYGEAVSSDNAVVVSKPYGEAEISEALQSVLSVARAGRGLSKDQRPG